jgi:hypothetical protein
MVLVCNYVDKRHTMSYNIHDCSFAWDESKNNWLKTHRNICFEDIIRAMAEGLYEVRENLSENHPGQTVYIIRIGGYAWVVPFNHEGDKIILKTAFPCRKINREFTDESIV